MILYRLVASVAILFGTVGFQTHGGGEERRDAQGFARGEVQGTLEVAALKGVT